jgi:hypothetical protein
LRAAVPTIWLAFALSLVFHAIILWGVHRPEHNVTFDKVGPAPPSPPSADPGESPPVRKTPLAKPVPRPPPPPPVLAQEKPAPVVAPPPKPEPTPPAPTASVAPDLDFSALLDARRRARGAPPQDSAAPTESAEDERQRHNRAVAANLGLDRAPTYGRDLTGGGVFALQRISGDSAEFLFYGWNKDIRRNSTQRIEVTKGENATIQVAVVRRMIGIIRDHESGDFTWVSRRLGRDVTLSARMKDNAGLEDFLLQEFFYDNRLR